MKIVRNQLTGNYFFRLFKLFPLVIGWVFSVIKEGTNNIVLVGSNRGISYSDNGRAMHEYLLKNTNFDVYWVTDKNQYDFQTVRLGSVYCYYLYFSAKYVFYTHSNSSDIAPLVGHFPFFKQPQRVFLSHGIEGLKKRLDVRLEDADVFTCATEEEKRIKNRYWNVPPEKLYVTGVARYDRLFDILNRKKRCLKSNTIVYLPTWREWDIAKEQSEFIKSDTYKGIVALLNSSELREFLNKNNLTLLIKLHPFFEKFSNIFDEFQTERIKTTDDSIDNLIIKAEMLITDYSSICWDFFYQKKPVYFYQFDVSKFNKIRGSYVDIKELVSVSNVSFDMKISYSSLEKTYKNFKLNKKLSSFLPPHDQKNCERILLAAQESIHNDKNT